MDWKLVQLLFSEITNVSVIFINYKKGCIVICLLDDSHSSLVGKFCYKFYAFIFKSYMGILNWQNHAV